MTEETKERTLTYFAQDGNYGSADGMTVMETTLWSELDWQMVDEVSDEHRATVARLITESYEPDADQEFLRKKLEEDYGFDFSDEPTT
jgi:hypothetical protein